jgi:hypothetical protein
MATTATSSDVNKMGLVEIAKRTNNGNVLFVSEVLSVNNECLMDMVWVPANRLGSHVHSRRLTLPDGTWRKMNAGATIEASQVQQIVENVGRLESWSQIDEMALDVISDKVGVRQTEERAFIMGLGQTLVETWITGTTVTDPERFDGLNVRLASTGTMVKSAGGSGSDLTSAYFVQWGEDKVHMVFLPDAEHPAQNAPVRVQDRGLMAVQNSGVTTIYDAYRTKYWAYAGMAVHDDRNLGRMPNIEDDASGANIFEPDLAIELLNEMAERGRGAYIYAHQKVLSQLDIMAMDKPNALYNIGNLWGEPVTRFRNCPLRHLESIGITQSSVS